MNNMWDFRQSTTLEDVKIVTKADQTEVPEERKNLKTRMNFKRQKVRIVQNRDWTGGPKIGQKGSRLHLIDTLAESEI